MEHLVNEIITEQQSSSSFHQNGFSYNSNISKDPNLTFITDPQQQDHVMAPLLSLNQTQCFASSSENHNTESDMHGHQSVMYTISGPLPQTPSIETTNFGEMLLTAFELNSSPSDQTKY